LSGRSFGGSQLTLQLGNALFRVALLHRAIVPLRDRGRWHSALKASCYIADRRQCG
jgi:hypothetical protein